MAPTRIFSGTYPDDFRVAGVNGHRTNGVRRLIIKNRLPGDPAIGRFPQAAGARSNVPGTWIGRAHRNIRDTPAHYGRANTPKGEAGNVFGYGCIVFRLDN